MIQPLEMHHWDAQIKCTLDDVQSFKYHINMYDYHL